MNRRVINIANFLELQDLALDKIPGAALYFHCAGLGDVADVLAHGQVEKGPLFAAGNTVPCRHLGLYEGAVDH